MKIPDKVLYDLLQWCVGNRGSKQGNPYCVPEMKEMLKAIARERGFADIDRNYFDAIDGFNPEYGEWPDRAAQQ